jgi:hypothetical protein
MNTQTQPAVECRLDGMVRPKPRLWVVRVTREAYVLACNEKEALAAQRDIERWEEYPALDAKRWGGELLNGWNDDCFVYGNVNKDIKLRDAKAMDAAP